MFCKIMDVERFQTVPFYIFGAMRLFKFLIFRLKLDFLSLYPPSVYNFFIIIRIFDVISEVNCVSQYAYFLSVKWDAD